MSDIEEHIYVALSFFYEFPHLRSQAWFCGTNSEGEVVYSLLGFIAANNGVALDEMPYHQHKEAVIATLEELGFQQRDIWYIQRFNDEYSSTELLQAQIDWYLETSSPEVCPVLHSLDKAA